MVMISPTGGGHGSGYKGRPRTASEVAAASSTTAAESGHEESSHNGGHDGNAVLYWLLGALVFFLVAGAVAFAWVETHNAAHDAAQLVFNGQPATQSEAGLVNHTSVRIRECFDSPVPDNAPVTRDCQHLTVGQYAEHIDIVLDNTSANTYSTVDVCGALIVQNDNGPGNPGETFVDNCVSVLMVKPGLNYAHVDVGGQFTFSTHIEYLDWTSIFKVEGEHVVGITQPYDTPGYRYCKIMETGELPCA